MRLSNWMANKSLVKAARQLFDNDTFVKMREVLEAESPLSQPLSPQGPTADDRSHRLGLIEGYQLCLTNLRMMAVTPPSAPKQLEATYPQPEE